MSCLQYYMPYSLNQDYLFDFIQKTEQENFCPERVEVESYDGELFEETFNNELMYETAEKQLRPLGECKYHNAT